MESSGKKDSDAQEVKDAFAPYAYNFITGTKHHLHRIVLKLRQHTNIQLIKRLKVQQMVL